MKFQSIRSRLPLTYVGIALITALVLGGALMVILRDYYGQREQIYLVRNARALGEAIAPLLTIEPVPAGLDEHIRLFAFLSRTRVRLLDGEGRLIADSGDIPKGGDFAVSAVSVPNKRVVRGDVPFEEGLSPSLKATALAAGKDPELPYTPEVPADSPAEGVIGLSIGVPVEGEQANVVPFTNEIPQKLTIFYSRAPWEVPAGKPVTGADEVFVLQGAAPGTMVSVIPVASSIYGYELQSETASFDRHSEEVVLQEIYGSPGILLGTLELSNGPAYGTEIVKDVAQAWILASALAVALAVGAGFVISRRLSSPLLALTQATRRMAEGDLSARADVRQQDEFGLLANAFNEMVLRMDETIRSLRRFAADAAHELKTPLTALRTNLELAAFAPDAVTQGEPDSRAYLTQAWEQVKRLEGLTNDLLDLSRLESGGNGDDYQSVDLAGLLRETCEPYASQAEQAGIDFQIELPAGACRVCGYPEELRRGVSNLLENAIKFTQTGARLDADRQGWVKVTLRAESVQAVIEVQDTGIGIPIEDQPFLFNRFHRGRNTAGYPGSGLGLTIVRAIVDRHAGELEIQSSEQGTCAIVRLPLVE